LGFTSKDPPHILCGALRGKQPVGLFDSNRKRKHKRSCSPGKRSAPGTCRAHPGYKRHGMRKSPRRMGFAW